VKGLIISIAAAVILLAAPSAGVAQTKLPVGEADGVRVVRERGVLVFVFTQRAAKLRKRIAGRVVEVDCVDQQPPERPPRADTGGFEVLRGENSGGEPVRAPKRGRKVVTGDRRRRLGDYCRVWLLGRPVRRPGGLRRRRIGLIVSVPLTQPGAVFLDEESKALNLSKLLFAVSLVAGQRHLNGWPTYGVLWDAGLRKLGKRFVRLASPADTPPAGAIGYYSDGHHHVAVAILSGSGRRLFIEYAGDALSTNVQGYIFRWRAIR
jgi:hypothetical protein